MRDKKYKIRKYGPREGEAEVVKFVRLASVARLSNPSQTVSNFVDSEHVHHWRRRIRRKCQRRRTVVHLHSHSNKTSVRRRFLRQHKWGFQFCLVINLSKCSTLFSLVVGTWKDGSIRIGFRVRKQKSQICASSLLLQNPFGFCKLNPYPIWLVSDCLRQKYLWSAKSVK